jgi:hypothetical protein
MKGNDKKQLSEGNKFFHKEFIKHMGRLNKTSHAHKGIKKKKKKKNCIQTPKILD